MKRVLLSWSSGKDSAWALWILRQQPDVQVAGLLTTFNETNGRVAMHGVRQELVQAQAQALRLPLWSVPLPYPCSNEAYEARMGVVLERAQRHGIDGVAFGDLFLEDIRAYRERMMAQTNLHPLFPLWCSPQDTPVLAQRMIQSGLRAVLVCLDPRHLSPTLLGRTYDAQLLSELPAPVDPCGERGEFHTFCFDGPMFSHPVAFCPGTAVERDGLRFLDLLPE